MSDTVVSQPNKHFLVKVTDGRQVSPTLWAGTCPSCRKYDGLRITLDDAMQWRPVCRNGCAQPAILEALHLTERDLLPIVTGGPEAFSLMPLTAMLQEPHESFAYAWDKTLPAAGLSILGAKPKVGKSTFARSLAMAVASGKDFFGRTTRKGPVVYLALEDKRDEFRAAMAKAMPRNTLLSDVLVHTGRAPREAMRALKSACFTFHPVLVVVDTLQKLIRVGDLNDYAKVNLVMEELMDIARKSNAHICVLHHFNKAAMGGGDSVLGSTALFGATDCLLEMQQRGDVRTLKTIQRYGTDLPETLLRIDEATGLVVSGGLAVDAEDNDLCEEIVQILQGPMTEAAIAEQLGYRRIDISRGLRRGMDMRRIRRTGLGVKGDPWVFSKAGDPVALKA